jgi:hypothetical protein
MSNYEHPAMPIIEYHHTKVPLIQFTCSETTTQFLGQHARRVSARRTQQEVHDVSKLGK